jgi:hypothetical protein
MPTEVVDLGIHNQYRWQLDGLTRDDTTFNAWVKDIRDRIKTPLELEGGATQNWTVGLVARWQGVTNEYGYGFLIKHRNAGVDSGREWFIHISGPTATVANLCRGADMLAQGAYGTYYQGIGVGAATLNNGTGDGEVGVHYTPHGATYGYDFTGVASDFDPPTNSPYSDITNFLPTTGVGTEYPEGVAFNTLFESNDMHWCLVFNHELPFVGIYYSESDYGSVDTLILSGDIVVPRVSGDARVEGNMLLTCTHGDGNGGNYLGRILVNAVDAAGVQSQYTDADNVEWHTAFTKLNQPRADGAYDVDPIKLVNSLDDKGYLDKTVVANVGHYKRFAGRMYETPDGTLMSIAEGIAVPWSTSDPLPFRGWPLVAQQLIGMGL